MMIACLLAALLMCPGDATAAATGNTSKPHIIFFMIDDYGNTDVGYHNRHYDNLLRTPNLDKLAHEGIKLESYYVQPLCTPTRSQFLSGRYQIHTGLQHGVLHPEMPSGLPVEIPILPQYLKKLGYRCHKVGKWHIGFYNNASCPWNRGFGVQDGGSDYGYLGGEEDYWTHEKNDPGYDFRDNGIIDRAVATTVDGDPQKYSTKLFRKRAESIIADHAANHSSEQLFLYLAFQAVHSPLQAPKYWMNQFDASAFNHDHDRLTYAAMVLDMDSAVGKVVEALKWHGMYDNAVMILSSDNGGILPGGYNWPYRGQKATMWDGGMRAVGFVHSPKLPQTGYVYNGLVHVSDWLPTLINLAGGDASAVDGLDGFDVWHAVTSNSASPRYELLHNIDTWDGVSETMPFGEAGIRVGDFKLLFTRPRSTGGHYAPPGCKSWVCRHPAPESSACLPDSKSSRVFLFNIAEDPYELCNLAESRPKVVKRLMRRLEFYNSTAVPINFPKFDPASLPANREGIEKGSWGPWKPDSWKPGSEPVMQEVAFTEFV